MLAYLSRSRSKEKAPTGRGLSRLGGSFWATFKPFSMTRDGIQKDLLV